MAAAYASPGSGTSLTIASLNLHCGYSANARPYDVAEILTGLDADIIAVQEAWWTPAGGPGSPAAEDIEAGQPAPAPRTAAAAGNTGTGGTAGAAWSQAADVIDGTARPDGASGTAGTGGAHGTGGTAGPGGAHGTGRTGEADGADHAGGLDPVGAAARARGARLIRTQLLSGVSLSELGIVGPPGRGNWGIAVLSRLPVTGHERISLGRAAGDDVERAALVCTVTTPGGWPLRLACTHLSPRLTSPAQLIQLTQHLARSTARPPTVIAGDLNMPRLATFLAGGFSPTVRGRTFPADFPTVQLDHLLAGPGLTCISASVLPPVGSDHLPVTGRFALAVRPVRRALTVPRPA